MIVLPAVAVDWSDEDFTRALVHELEHVRRMDGVIQFAARFTSAWYWFHPLVWVAWRRLCLEAKRACDDAVVQRADRADYAEQLVLMAQRMSKQLRNRCSAWRTEATWQVAWQPFWMGRNDEDEPDPWQLRVPSARPSWSEPPSRPCVQWQCRPAEGASPRRQLPARVKVHHPLSVSAPADSMSHSTKRLRTATWSPSRNCSTLVPTSMRPLAEMAVR